MSVTSLYTLFYSEADAIVGHSNVETRPPSSRSRSVWADHSPKWLQWDHLTFSTHVCGIILLVVLSGFLEQFVDASFFQGNL